MKANRGAEIVGRGYYTPRDRGLVSPAFSFGAQVAEVEVDQETGLIKVEKMTTAHDCGTVINPMSVEGQLEGSIHMGFGIRPVRTVRHARRPDPQHHLPRLQDARGRRHASG